MSSPRIETAKLFLAAFSDFSVAASKQLAIRSPDCTHVYAPASLPPPPPQDNEAFEAFLNSLTDIMSGFPATAKEIIDSEKGNAVTIWATSNAQFFDEVKDDGIPASEWEYRGEYVVMLHMDLTGRKINRIVEFVDSKSSDRLWTLIIRAKANRKKLDEKA
jgi:hypothetical protein